MLLGKLCARNESGEGSWRNFVYDVSGGRLLLDFCWMV